MGGVGGDSWGRRSGKWIFTSIEERAMTRQSVVGGGTTGFTDREEGHRRREAVFCWEGAGEGEEPPDSPIGEGLMTGQRSVRWVGAEGAVENSQQNRSVD